MNKPIGLLPKPILIDIRKDSIFVKAIGEEHFFEGELYAWLKRKRKRRQNVVHVGTEFQSDHNLNEEDYDKYKLFYNDPNKPIDNFDVVAESIEFMTTRNVYSKAYLIKPIVILNCPYDLSKDDLTALVEIFYRSAREVIILKSESRPDENTLRENMMIPYEVIEGSKKIDSGKSILTVTILLMLCLLGMFLYMKR